MIFDESDKYFELGFIESIEQILQKISKIPKICKIFFSAIISEDLITIINFYKFIKSLFYILMYKKN